jgi:hypothetical protein
MQWLRQWCEDVNRVKSDVKYDFVYVDEEGFNKYNPTSFQQLVSGFNEYKNDIVAVATRSAIHHDRRDKWLRA